MRCTKIMARTGPRTTTWIFRTKLNSTYCRYALQLCHVTVGKDGGNGVRMRPISQIQWILFMTESDDVMPKNTQKWNVFGYGRAHGELPPISRHFVAICRRADRYVTLQLMVFEIFAVKWQKSVSERPKMVLPKPFLDPHLETPKDIPNRRGRNDVRDHRANFHVDRWHCRWDICLLD